MKCTNCKENLINSDFWVYCPWCGKAIPIYSPEPEEKPSLPNGHMNF